MSYSRVLQSNGLEGLRDRLSDYGVNYIVNNIKTSEAWLRFAKYYPPKYIRKRLLKLGYEINNRDYWENSVFRIKNNLTNHQQIGNDPKYRDFKIQLALYEKGHALLIIQKTYHLWRKKINSAKIIQHAVIKWLYRPGGSFMKQAKDRYHQRVNRKPGYRNPYPSPGLKLDDEDFAIIRKRKIDGQVFLKLTKDDFMQAGLEMGPAIKLADEVKSLKTMPKRPFSSYHSLKEVLAKYGMESEGIDAIPLFSPPIPHSIQDDDVYFEECITEINKRLRDYGTLYPDSLEAMRNEKYTNKTDFANTLLFQDSEDLICITEDKQHKIPMGFAQNIKQLESSFETNKRKRKRDEAFDDDFDYLYGIVTTGRDWHFLLYSPGEIAQASESAYTIEFNKKSLDKDSEEYTQYTIVSLRELNTKLTVEISELRKKYAELEANNIE
ncbi:694_t:CDS:2, partial [Ambispora gerdemannii]